MRERVAKSIAAHADAWRRGDIAPMDAEMRLYLSDEAKARVEAVARQGTSSRTRPVYDAVIAEFARR